MKRVLLLLFLSVVLAPIAMHAADGPIVKLTMNADGKTKTMTFTVGDQSLATGTASSKGDNIVYSINNAPWCGYGYGSQLDSITKVVFDPSFAQVQPTRTENWFNGMKNLTDIEGIENLNTSKVTNMSSMFAGCSSLTSIDLSHFETANCENFQQLFRDCRSLKSLDLKTFNTTNGYMTSMQRMFDGCTSLESVDVSSFNFVKEELYRNAGMTISLERMFRNCSSLKSLDLSNFDVSSENVRSETQMFDGCTGLKELKLHDSFSKISYAYNMFNKVGTTDSPCYLNVSDTFDKTVLGSEQDGVYTWMNGKFTLNIPTAISKIIVDEEAVNGKLQIYNLAGQRVSEDYKGIVIINGRKQIKK